ncbi:MAG: DNA/RNA helicase domain-containing protein, partial [bacterium]
PYGWSHWSFRGEVWNRIHKPEIQQYQLNAYRVLLTRARQGMVIFIPEGDPEDHTRKSEYYDPTFEYLADIGFTII